MISNYARSFGRKITNHHDTSRVLQGMTCAPLPAAGARETQSVSPVYLSSARRYSPTSVIGTTISHYRILDKLGEGGMSVVYRAQDTKLERPVALKFLSPLLVRDQEVRKRFEREAKAAAALQDDVIATGVQPLTPGSSSRAADDFFSLENWRKEFRNRDSRQ